MSPGRPRHKQKVNMRVDLQEIGYESINWIHIAQNRDQQQNLKVQYHVDKNLPLHTILRQMNRVHIFTPYLFKEIHYYYSLLSFPVYLNITSCLFLCFLTQNFYGLHFCSMHVTFHDHLIFLFDCCSNIWCIVQIMKLLIKNVCPLFCYILPFRSKCSSQPSVLKHSPSAAYLLFQDQRPSFMSIQHNR